MTRICAQSGECCGSNDPATGTILHALHAVQESDSGLRQVNEALAVSASTGPGTREKREEKKKIREMELGFKYTHDDTTSFSDNDDHYWTENESYAW